MPKRELVSDIVMFNIFVRLYQYRSIKKALEHKVFSKNCNTDFDLDSGSRTCPRYCHIKHLCDFISKSVHILSNLYHYIKISS